MKRTHFSLAALLLGTVVTLSSCSDAEEVMNPSNLETDSGKAPVSVHISEFSIYMEDFPALTRDAVPAANCNDVAALTLAFYDANDNEVYKVTQLKSDASTFTTFGLFTLDLQVGSYTMVAVGRGVGDGDIFTLTSPTEAVYGNRVRDTFVATQEVEITSSAAVDLTATLNRAVAMVFIQSIDSRTAEAKKIQATFSAGGKAFNPTSGLATVNTGFSNAVTGTGSEGQAAGATNYLFLATDEQTMDIDIDILDADGGSIIHKVAKDVPLKRNRITTLRGTLFTNSTASIQVESSWLTGNSMDF